MRQREMPGNDTTDSLSQAILNRHADDLSQLAVIQSEETRLLVEAPAGYGKTSTMVSRLAYLLVNGKVINFNRILALTFSVNAAYKIKKDVISLLPQLLARKRKDEINRMFVSNYHGFSRHLLSKYGYLLKTNFRNIGNFETFDDSKVETLMTQFHIEQNWAFFLSNFNDKIKDSNITYIDENIDRYNSYILENFVANNCIPYNGILSLTIKLLSDFPVIKAFYRQYFSTLIVDEFQDTNYLSYSIVKNLIASDTNLIFLGDSLQRIYGFIGAMPGLMHYVVNEFNLTRLELETNHRFKDNPGMLLLDKNIRENARDPYTPNIQKETRINHHVLNDQNEEANYILSIITGLQAQNPSASITILVKQRSRNTEAIVSTLASNNVPFFNGLFTDEDKDYLSFCKSSLVEFNTGLSKGRSLKKALNYMLHQLQTPRENENQLNSSFLKLLAVFSKYIQSEYGFLTPDEKIDLVRETLDHNGLKQYMQYLESKITITTVHGAKGLEWEYIIVPDMEAYNFPNYSGLCGACNFNSKRSCNLEIDSSYESKFLEELSVFYVSVTRARKDVFFTSSRQQINYQGQNVFRNLSCFLKLPGIAINENS